jgi:predicted Zn-dependent peptidase
MTDTRTASQIADTEVTTLANGMRVVSHHMPHVETVSLGVWVGTGARHEQAAESGMSHLLEHMAFKGTAKRSAQQIAEEIEQVGGDLNAATSLETTAYYSRVLKADVPVAMEIIADILQNPKYSADELEREREVILQEIASTRDSPDEIAYDLLNDVAYPDQAIGRPILGTAETVGDISVGDLRQFLERHYGAGHMVISAAGHVNHGALVRHAEALFGGLNRGETGVLQSATYQGGSGVSQKSFEQSHLVMGFEGPSYRAPDFYTAQVFSGLFGGGMSSRLFQEVRERRGLCYSIYSSCWALGDTGMFGVHAATGNDMMDELVEVVRQEFIRAAADRPADREVDRAKAQLKAGLLMSLESSGARAEQMARQTLLFNRLVTPAELIERVEGVTAEGIRTFAEAMIKRTRPSVAVVGAGRRSQAHADAAALPFDKIMAPRLH